MKLIKTLTKTRVSKNGETAKYYQLVSETNEKNRGKLNKEKFDIKFEDIKKLTEDLKEKGKKFLINGLNKRSWTNITNIDGKLTYQDNEDYLKDKLTDVEALSKFAQLTVIIFE